MRVCSYCGTSKGNINLDIFTDKFYCENEECIKKARKETKEYLKNREKKINQEFKLTEVKTQEDLENILYALYGLMDKMGKTKDLGPMAEPDFFKNRAMYLIASEIPENFITIRMGKIDKTKVELQIKKNIPVNILKDAMKKAGLID